MTYTSGMVAASPLTALVIRDPNVPLEIWDDGSIRVGGTRLLLDTVLDGFNMGESPEEIARVHGGLAVEIIRQAIWYYERNREEIEEYLRCGREAADEAYRQIMALPGQAEAVAKLWQRVADERGRRAERSAEHPH